MARKQTLALLALAAFAAPALAGSIDGNAVIGGALGGGAGAAVGSAIGGRDGAIIGGAIGGATGAAIATKGTKQQTTVVEKQPTVVEREVVYVHDSDRGHRHHDNGLHLGQRKGRHGHDYD